MGVAEDERDPPSTAEELLRRYAAGERNFLAARLHGADLSGADLSRAELCEVDLGEAELRGADLRDAILRHTSFFHTDLSGADLSRAELCCADFTGAVLERAVLSGANLEGAVLSGADLSGADLSGAVLEVANLADAILEAANISGAHLNHTILANVDLAALCDADPPVSHDGPSIVDYRSILRSVRVPRLRDFLVRTGMPEVFAEYMVDCARSLSGDVFQMLQSTFISYGQPDEAFARKLYEALHRNGVTTFFFPEHAVPGKKVGRTMREGVNQYDRVILICSKASLSRPGVLAEIEHTLSREDREGGASRFIPILLDDYLFSDDWKPPNADVKLVLKERVAADFRGADTDDAKFQAGLQKLIRALRVKTVP